MDINNATPAEIADALNAREAGSARADGDGVWLIDPDFPRDKSLQVWVPRSGWGELDLEPPRAPLSVGVRGEIGRICKRGTDALPTTPIPVRFLR